MSQPFSPDTKALALWLGNLGIDHYLCDHCAGLHLTRMQGMEGVVESRLFAEDWGLLISTEFQLRPSSLLAIVADLGQLNTAYPTLKIFVDIVDEALPQLVAGATVLTGAGLGEAQFALFMSTATDLMTRLAEDLRQVDCLLGDEVEDSGGHRLH